MYNSENRTISIRLVYVLLFIGMIVAAIVFITNKNSIVSSDVIADVENINSNQLNVASTTTSRSSSEIRKLVKEQQEENKTEESKAETKVEEKTETKTENKSETKTTKKTSAKTKKATTAKSSTKTSKKSSEKNETKTEEKKSSKKNSTKKEESKKSTTKTTPISKVKISRTMDLTKRTGLSRKDFIKIMSNVKADTSGFFEDNAGKIYDLCEKYSINEIFFCGLISAESGWNIASNHRRTHNYISMMSRGKLIHYDSVNEGLEAAAKLLHKNYLTPGGAFYHGKTLAGVKTCFCPSATWVNLVYGRMQQIL